MSSVLLICASTVVLMDRPLPLDMPRAESYLVSDARGSRLEDRYQVADLWLGRTLLGCWADADGRIFSLSRLETHVPEGERLATRVDYAREVRPIARRDAVARRQAMQELASVSLAEQGERPRQPCRGYDHIAYWQGTNEAVIACEFRPERSDCSYFAEWVLTAEDDPDERIRVFEREFLERQFAGVAVFPSWREFQLKSEAEALRADAHDSITNFPSWHWTDAADYTVLDDLPADRGLVTVLTNTLPKLKADFVRVLPTPLCGTNVLGIVRLFGSRAEYLAVTDEALQWSAAYWSSERREIVAYLPPGGEEQLLRTLRHEAFHQYLSYATAMIPASPWLNEGYAQYFEDPHALSWDLPLPPEELEDLLSTLFDMDYEAFYAGTDQERRLNYRLAWSIAVFLEHGADDVRNDPFRDFKRDYLRALVSSRDMHKATAAALGSADRRRLLIAEWRKFWRNTSAD